MRKVLNFVVNLILTALNTVGLNTPNRVVVALSPLFVTASGFICAWVASNVPGAPSLDAGDVTGLFVAGATLATTKVLLWLHGWQKHEMMRAYPPEVKAAAETPPPPPPLTAA